MSLALLERHTETADFGFKGCDVADGTDCDTSEVVSAAPSLGEFASVAVSCALFTTFLRCLTACSGGFGKSGGDACGQETQFED